MRQKLAECVKACSSTNDNGHDFVKHNEAFFICFWHFFFLRANDNYKVGGDPPLTKTTRKIEELGADRGR
jgi:hypothetical protein